MKKSYVITCIMFFIINIANGQLLENMNSIKTPQTKVSQNVKYDFKENTKQLEVISNTNYEPKLSIDALQKEKNEQVSTRPMSSTQLVEFVKSTQAKMDSALNYLKEEKAILDKNDSIVFVNNAKIENTIWLIDSFSNKQALDKVNIVDEIIQLKYLSRKRYEKFGEYKQQYRDAKAKLDSLVKIPASDYERKRKKIKELIIDYQIEKTQFQNSATAFKDANTSVSDKLKEFTAVNVTPKKNNAEKDNKEYLKLNNNFLNDLVITPTLTLLGSNHLDKNYSYKETGLSIGLINDKLAQNNLNFFYSDLSTFKLFTRFNILCSKLDTIDKKNNTNVFSINTDISFIGKRYFGDTSKSKNSYNATMFFLKLGFERTLITNLISIYGNVRAFAPISGFSEFREFKNTNKSVYGTLDFGFNFLLIPAPKREDGLNILLNLNFLTNSGDVKTFTKYDGFLIPSLRIGIAKTLNIFGKKNGSQE